MYDADTIAAISTSLGNSGIHIIRISGNQSFEVINRIFKKGKKMCDFDASLSKSHTIHYGYIVEDNSIIDEVLVSVFRGPNSFTAEDTIEINCHGGSFVVQRILKAVIDNGARFAAPGEFSKRAFLNGRIDLTQAEAVMDIINSKNEYSLKASVKQVKGDVKNEIQHLREQLLSKIALIEATLDDPEHYSFDERFYSETSDMIDSVISEVNLILSKSKNGIVLKEGIKTVIAGKPNVGKSSIMNYLLNDEKAIVTDIPGTTRDVIEYSVSMDNVTLNLVDTAGIHETDNLIEQIGIDRTKRFIEDADLILCVFDSSRSPDDEDIEIYDMVKDKRHICIYNKCDIDKYSSDYIDIIGNTNIIRFSTKEKYGYNELVDKINKMFYDNVLDVENELYITNVRHMELLGNTLNSLNIIKDGLNELISEDMLTIDMLDAYNYLGEIIGETIDDDVVDKIFSEFCMGK